MERGEWDNDADYPSAPLPAHERTWRHPSEMGEAHWVRSEPPLVVGRGLSVATGAVGAVLALGLLWLMVPHPNRDADVAAEFSTTTVRALALATTPASPRVAASTAGSELLVGTSSSPPTTAAADELAAETTIVASLAPVPTMVLAGDGDANDNDMAAPLQPVAVALTAGHYVVTTAAAVRGRESFAVYLPSGETVVGSVVAVDVANGTAVLSVSTEMGESLIEVSSAGFDTVGVTVMAPEPTSASLWIDDDATQVGYQNNIGVHSSGGEGSLVLDADGRLMGMCTRSATGVQMVSVAALLDALAAAAGIAPPAWLGIRADIDADGRVVVMEVLDGGPAAAAGLQAGDVLVAIDGIEIADLETLRAVLNSYSAGDTIIATVHDPNASERSGTVSTGTVSATTVFTSTSTSPTAAPTVTSTTTSMSTTTFTITEASPPIAFDIVITLAQPPGAG
ncbi:MAG: PDZ domain-containing protein [Ilumatobacteraceae bacterium]